MKYFLKLVLFVGMFFSVCKVEATIHITIELSSKLTSETDSVGNAYVLQKEENESLGSLIETSFFKVSAVNNDFCFSFPNDTKYIDVIIPYRDGTKFPDAFFLNDVFLEPGDSVHIYFEDLNNFTVKGKNWHKFHWYLESQALGFEKGNSLIRFDQNPALWLDQQYNLLKKRQDLLYAYKIKLSQFAYDVISANLIGGNNLWIYRIFRENNFGFIFSDSLGKQGFKLYKDKLYKKEENLDNEVMLEQSAYYASYLMQKTWCDRTMDQFFEEEPISNFFLDTIIAKYPVGVLRDNILLAYLYRDHLELNKEFYQIKDSLLITDKYQKMVDKIWEVQHYANKVDSTIFRDKNGNVVRLTDFKGKVLYLDFWFTGCAGCVNVAKALPEVEKAFEGRDEVVFISISIDADKKKWLESIEPIFSLKNSRRLYSHYVTDKTLYLHTDGKRANIPILKNFNKVGTYPFMVLVDKEGNIVTNNPPRPDSDSGKYLIRLINSELNK